VTRGVATGCWVLCQVFTLGCGELPRSVEVPAQTGVGVGEDAGVTEGTGPDERGLGSQRGQEGEERALDSLAAAAVYDDDFARAELYTWTTVEQLTALRDSRVLLVADAASGGRTSPFNAALARLAETSTSDLQARIARVLVEDPRLRRHRYAWPSPFATTMGLAGRRYGDSLVRIELEARAWVGHFEPGTPEPLRFVDMQGREVPLVQVLAEPERIAALYHLRSPPESALAYREYVVCSTAMIRAWSIATPEIAARVRAEIEMLAATEVLLGLLPRAAVLEAAAPDWTRRGDSNLPLARWHAALAFDNIRYQPSRTNLAAIAATLEGCETDGGPPLRVEPGRVGVAR